MSYEAGNHNERVRRQTLVEAFIHYEMLESPAYLKNVTENTVLRSRGYDPPWENTPSVMDEYTMGNMEELLAAYVEFKSRG